MQLRDIQYVLAAADEGSFSKAARKVHVSQPALSQLIQGWRMNWRQAVYPESSQVALTSAGEVFCEDGREILRKSQELLGKMRDFQTLKKGRTDHSYRPLLPEMLPGGSAGRVSETVLRHPG